MEKLYSIEASYSIETEGYVDGLGWILIQFNLVVEPAEDGGCVWHENAHPSCAEHYEYNDIFVKLERSHNWFTVSEKNQKRMQELLTIAADEHMEDVKSSSYEPEEAYEY
tara:strand:+ start:205 stop:534 length:330 start_codon:yes stop_codon:yes gene_type:complete